jgi:hypothetical protein
MSAQRILYATAAFSLAVAWTFNRLYERTAVSSPGWRSGNPDPKSIIRLRLSGSGMRFVHGGATCRKLSSSSRDQQKRPAIGQVDVEIGVPQLAIPSAHCPSRFIRLSGDRELQPRRHGAPSMMRRLIVSDSQADTFDRTSVNPREREIPGRFILTRKSDAQRQGIILMLEERFAGSILSGILARSATPCTPSFTSDTFMHRHPVRKVSPLEDFSTQDDQYPFFHGLLVRRTWSRCQRQ